MPPTDHEPPVLRTVLSAERPGAATPDRAAVLAALRARVARIEGGAGWEEKGGFGAGSPSAIPICAEINAHLPGNGLARAAVHDLLCGEDAAATALATIMLARAAAQGGGSIFWISADADGIWLPGMVRLGLSPASLIVVKAEKPADALWAAEEALRCKAIAGVAVDLERMPDLTATRRLQIAAEQGNEAIGLLLLRDTPANEAALSASRTRWRLCSAPSLSDFKDGLGAPRWRLELIRAKGAPAAEWTVAWHEASQALVADGVTSQETAAKSAGEA